MYFTAQGRDTWNARVKGVLAEPNCIIPSVFVFMFHSLLAGIEQRQLFASMGSAVSIAVTLFQSKVSVFNLKIIRRSAS